MHLKDEPYAENKAPRAILARDDVGKAVYLLVFNKLDHSFFNGPFAVKHVPYGDRPAFINSLFGTRPVMSGDYSSWECS